jgi:hypothetical protein
MRKGFGKTQRAIAAMIKAQPDGAWAYEQLAERIYGTALFTRAQKNAIGRALANMRLPGTWAVLQASFNKDRRFWLFDPCNLESWRKVAGPRWDPAHFHPGGVIFGWMEESKRRAKARAPVRPPLLAA